eukprot:NODE_2296_length_631_cov_559.268041_g1946_i0.p2 GENE.NODE_2296_length_631_cov_559.268041_g1946_i0~~NODE_2296_length_631_cov_559.268041_g1946_i0.p2  ORF type:complete len:126 (-),score=47.01 NODE_2296_length_631_cov_559.268041_g1946_i0:223-600(-)
MGGLLGSISMGLSKTQVDELACTYAALLLFDDNIPVSEDKIAAVTEAAGLKVETYYPGLFARYLAGKNIADLLGNVGSGAAAPAAAAPAAAAAEPAAKGADKKKEEKKAEPEEEEDADMGFGLFD